MRTANFGYSLLLGTLAVAGCGTSCGGKTVGPNGTDASDSTVVEPDASVEAGLPDAHLPLDGEPDTPDASPNPYVVQLPPSGQADMGGFTNAGYIVAYADRRGPPEKMLEVYFYDLLTMQEFKITDRVESQASPYVTGHEIMFDDGQFYDPQNGVYQIELYLYNIDDATEIRLTDSATIKSSPKFNQDYILYWSNEGCPTTFDMNLSLMNRHTMEVTVVSDCDQDPETHSISDNFAAWTARPYPGHNKDIYVRDLQGEFTFRIESTDFADQFFPHTDDDHVIWMDYRDGRREIYMHTFSTGQEVCLTPDGWEQAWPHLRNGIASWCDYSFSQDSGELGNCDVYVYELATGVGRRVTAESKTWMPRFVDSGWILYGLRMTAHQFKLFAHDLVGDGILTTDGHVIP